MVLWSYDLQNIILPFNRQYFAEWRNWVETNDAWHQEVSYDEDLHHDPEHPQGGQGWGAEVECDLRGGEWSPAGQK